MRKSSSNLVSVGLFMLLVSTGLASCEDDPILAPNSSKKANGSYGNIAFAPPIDSSASSPNAGRGIPPNPEVY